MMIKKIIKKNGNIVYRQQVYLGIDSVTGQKRKATLTARTTKELKQKALHARLEFEKNGYTVIQQVKLNTVNELIDLWFDTYRHTVKASTATHVQKLIKNHLKPLYGFYKLNRLTTPILQSIINKMANATNTRKKGAYQDYHVIHGRIKSVLQYGVVMQVIPYNPARDVILPRNKARITDTKVKYFNTDELKVFLTHINNLDMSNFKNCMESMIYKLLLATGLRISELLALEWEDVDFEENTITINKTLDYHGHVTSPKTQSSNRTISVDQATMNLLKAYRLRQAQEYWKVGATPQRLFTTVIKESLSSQLVLQWFKLHVKALELPNIGLHGFRHTHASLLLNAGIPYKDLQERLGHSDIKTTLNTYSHLFETSKKNAVSFYEKALISL